MKVAVVLVNFNGLVDTVECLNSIACTEDSLLEVIVVDNASSNSEVATIDRDFPWVTVIASSENTGWSGGNNLGIRHALRMSMPSIATRRLGASLSEEPADVVLLLNNDTVVDRAIIDRIRDAVARGFDIAGPIINEYHNRDLVQTEGVLFNPALEQAVGFFHHVSLDRTKKDEITQVDIVNGCAVAITRRVFDKIGLVDEKFFLVGEESDFCLRAQAAGFRAGVLHQSLVFHKHSVSFKRAGKPLQRYYSIRNLWLLVNRHSGLPGRRGLLRSRIEYIRYAFQLYSHERNLNNPVGAQAVAIGMADAFRNRFGQQPIESSWLSWCIEWFAALGWRIRRDQVQTQKTASENA